MWNFFEFKCVLEGKEELLSEGLAPRPQQQQQDELGQEKQTQGYTAEKRPALPVPSRRSVPKKPENTGTFRARSRHGEDVGKYHTNTKNPLMGLAISKQVQDPGRHLDPKKERGPSTKLDDVAREYPEFARQFQTLASMVARGERSSLGDIIDTLGIKGGGRGQGGQALAGGLSPDASKMARALMILRKLHYVDFVDREGNSLSPGQPPNADTIIVPADSVYRGEAPEELADMGAQRAADRESRKGYGRTAGHQRQAAIRRRDIEQARHPERMTGHSEAMSKAALAAVSQEYQQLVKMKEGLGGLNNDAGRKAAAKAAESLQAHLEKPISPEARQKVAALIKRCKEIAAGNMHKEWLEFYSLMEQYGV